MKNGSERLLLELSEQDRLQQQVRLFISSFKTTDPGPHRKGAAYTSHSVSSGRRLFSTARRFGYTDVNSFKAEAPQRYRTLVLRPNVEAGARFGSLVRSRGWPLTIVPGQFYAQDWSQVHYMAAWRPVIIFRATSVHHDTNDMGWTFGGVEEYKIGILNHKRMFLWTGNDCQPADLRRGADIIRRTVDRIAGWGFDPKLIYEQWQEVDLLCDEVRTRKRRSVLAAAR